MVVGCAEAAATVGVGPVGADGRADTGRGVVTGCAETAAGVADGAMGRATERGGALGAEGVAWAVEAPVDIARAVPPVERPLR